MTNKPEPVTCPHCQHEGTPLRWWGSWGRIVDVCKKCGAVLFDNNKQKEGTKQHASR